MLFKKILSGLSISFFLLNLWGCSQKNDVKSIEVLKQVESEEQVTEKIPLTQAATQQEEALEIKKLTSGIVFNPMILANYIIFQQSSDISQKMISLYLYDLNGNFRKVGDSNKVSRTSTEVKTIQGGAALTRKYFMWFEVNSSDTQTSTNLYYSALNGNLAKNLIIKYPQTLQFSAGSSKSYYFVVDDMLYYLDPNSSNIFKIFDLKENKAAGEFSFDNISKENHGNFDFLGIYKGVFYYYTNSMTQSLIGVDIASGQKVFNKDLGIAAPSSSLMQFSEGKLLWITKANDKVIIHSFDIETKQEKVLVDDIPDSKNFVGYGITDNGMIWVSLNAEDPNKGNLYWKDFDSGIVINLLEKDNVSLLAGNNIKSFNVPKMISGNSIVFIGYEGDLKDDFSNTALYLLTIK